MPKKVTKSLPFESFDAVYCSGLFIPDSSIITAMSLLFERIHILNHLEYVINFSKKFHFHFPPGSPIQDIRMRIKPNDKEAERTDPLEGLSSEEKQTACYYLWFTQQFLVNYRKLFKNGVFNCSLLPDGEIFGVKLIKKGPPGKKNLYNVWLKPMTVSSGGQNELDSLISQRAIPVLSMSKDDKSRIGPNISKMRYLASLLAMKSIKLVLPQFKSADEVTILEARDRLKDFLPPFWSSMLKLSAELEVRLKGSMAISELEKESEDIVDSTVRPALIDLNQKLLKERKNWFYKIITPVTKGLKVMLGKPSLSNADLISSGLILGANVALDVADNLKKAGRVSQEAGLTFLLELGKFLRK